MFCPLLFIMVIKKLSRIIGSGCSKELLYVDDLILVGETLDGLKGRYKAWKRAESIGFRVNVKKTNMMISSENFGKVTIEGRFSCAVCTKGNSILCKFCESCMHNGCKWYYK